MKSRHFLSWPNATSIRNITRSLPRKLLAAWLMVMLLGPHVLVALAQPTLAATSPWTQTDWSGGSGQASWADATKFDSSSNVVTATTGEATLTNSEKLTNTGFESDTSSWTPTAEATAGSFSDSTFANTSGAVAAWPLDETTSTQSYARAVNPAVSTGRNVVINGTFDADASWAKGTGWTISGGTAVATNVNVGVTISQVIPVVIGKAYSITYTISGYSGGTVYAGLGAIGSIRSADGTYTQTLVATGTTFVFATNSSGTTLNIDNVTVTQLNVPAYNSSQTQLLADGDMETAGVSSWTVNNSATVTKQTSSPHGGSQVIRVARNGVNSPWISQSILTVGQVYRISGYARSDGSAVPIVINGAGGNLWVGTASTSWQPFDLLYLATGSTTINFADSTSTGTQYVEFDDLVVSPDNYIRSGELLPDGNMETSGTGYWSTTLNATLTKETSSPHGGTQFFRVARNGTNNPNARQLSIFITGKKYRVTGFARSDGSATPIWTDGTTTWFTGTTSTSWQPFDITFIASNTAFGMASTTSTGTQYTDWDDISITEVDPLVGAPTNGVILGSTANGHLTNAYTFDGTNDLVNIYSSDLNSSFNSNEGTLIAWAQVSSSSIWTNGSVPAIVAISPDASNYILIRKESTNNTVGFYYTGGGTAKAVLQGSQSSTGWMQVALSWSKTNDQVKAYINGIQVGTTQTGLGTFVGNLSSNLTAIGAARISPMANPWSGMINDVRLYNRPLTATEIANLYNGFTAARDTGQAHGGTASMKVVTDTYSNADIIQSVNVGDTNTYNLVSYAYTNGSAVTSADAELFYNGATVSTTYTSVGSGWYKLSGTVTGANAARNYGVQVKAGKTVYLDDFSVNNYATSGTLTSSIFDTGQGSNWGTLTYNATAPTGTAVVLKVRSSNSASMSGATAFSSCAAITSGTDISSNNCMADNNRYVQYQLSLSATDTSLTPTFQDISIPFTISDVAAPSISLVALSPDPNTNTTPTFSGTTTEDTGTVSAVQFQVDSTSGSWSSCTAADGTFNSVSEAFSCTTTTLADGPHIIYLRATDSNGNTTSPGNYVTDSFVIDHTASAALELHSPGDNSYTNNERPTFTWKATTDATAGVAKYVLEIDNPSIGGVQPSGDFTIDNIPTSGTTDVIRNQYVIHFEGFTDADPANDTISVFTRSASEWGNTENDGKVREGIVHWKVKAIDNAGNEAANVRTLFVDRTSPRTTLTQLNDIPADGNSFATTDQTPTVFGRITDPLAGSAEPQLTQTEAGPKVASGPHRLDIQLEKRTNLLYSLIGTYTQHLDMPWYSCDDERITDNSKQKCDKYLPFEFTPAQALSPGTYRLTLKSTDLADNTAESSMLITIGTLNEVASSAEKQVIEERIKDLSPAQQDNIKKEIEITKPVAPSVGDKTEAKVTQVKTSVFSNLSHFFSNITTQTGNLLVMALRGIGSSLAMLFDGSGRLFAALGNVLATGISTITNGVGSSLAWIGQGLGTSATTIGQSYTAAANLTPGLIRSGLLAIGQTASTLSNAISVSTHSVAYFMQSVSNAAANEVRQTGNALAMALHQTTLATQDGITAVAFIAGEKVQDTSDTIGLAIIEFTYNFVSEPTRISNVKVARATPTSMTITWSTNHPATSKVNYGLTPDYGQDVQSDKRVRDHEITVTGLQPNTQYAYEVMSQNKVYSYDANHTFTTPNE